MSKIKGQDLMVFLAGESIAFGTNHTITISGDTADTSNKDEGAGGWASSEISKLSWSAHTENLMADSGSGKTYDDLVAMMLSKQPVDLVFARKTETSTDVGEAGWTPQATASLAGKAIISSLELNAPNGENSTFTADFTGVGALKHTAPSV